MDSELKNYIDRFEERLNEVLYTKCISLKLLTEGKFLESDDIINWWKYNAPFYMSDAVREFNQYPLVVLAWASFLAMAVTTRWDKDWDKYKDCNYQSYYGQMGFDDMDENIMQNYLNIQVDSKQASELSDILRSLADETIALIRHEKIEGGTERAFHILAKSIKCMFRIGSSICLSYLGYRWQKMNIGKNYN